VVPFLVWIVVGALLQICFTQQQLFAAVNGHYSAATDVVMYYVTIMGEGLTVTIILLALLFMPSLRNWWYFRTALACSLVPFFAQQFLKTAFFLPRPLNYFHRASWIHVSPSWPLLMERSFPSGHSEGAFSLFCFLSLLLPADKQRYGLLFFFLALAVGYSRMYLAAHFFEDVYAGSLIGGSFTLFTYLVMHGSRNRPRLAGVKKLQR